MFGASTTLLNADHYNVYFKGMPVWSGKVCYDLSIANGQHIYFMKRIIILQVLRRHGDEFEFTKGGYYRAHGRADDTMNLGGIKVYLFLVAILYNCEGNSFLLLFELGKAFIFCWRFNVLFCE